MVEFMNKGAFHFIYKDHLMDINFIVLAFITAASYLTLAFSGFGTIIITITLAAHMYSIKMLLPILVPLTLLANIYILLRHYKYVNASILFKKIVPFMGIGLILGIGAFHFFQGELLKKILGILVILLSISELYKLFSNSTSLKPFSKLKSISYIISAGIAQGIYASGGPLLVYAITKLNLSKSVFRSTLSAVWLIMNTILTLSYIVTGKMTIETGKFSIMLLPSMVVGLFIGEILHQRINEKSFKICVNVLLFAAGIILVIR